MGRTKGDEAGLDASFDAVGKYRQDDVNGFSKELIDAMLAAAALERAGTVLDAMAGDGNLTLRLREYCRERGIPLPKTTVLEFSRVQAEFAKKELAGTEAEVVWGDVLTLKGRADGRELPEGAFDRVLIKSSNHEIPASDQPRLYASVFRALRPGGLYVNLGMVFDTAEERDELRSVARVKDTRAGMSFAARNRHFLTREELYGHLAHAGFVDARAAASLDYVIRSRVVAEQYFPSATRLESDLEHQAAQIKAVRLRENGRISFHGTGSVMRLPGEITVARRPSLADTNARVFREYPMDFLRHVRVHAEMLEEASRYVGNGERVLDVGCGIGLFAEHLHQPGVAYTGLDVSEEFVEAGRRRFAGRPGFRFERADAARAELGEERFDAVALLNTLNLPGLDAVGLLGKARAALRPSGRVIVAGPASRESFVRVEERILAQLKQDGKLDGYASEIEGLRDANRRLLTGLGNYWSVEGMAALLRHLGYGRILAASNGLYYGASYLVVAEK